MQLAQLCNAGASCLIVIVLLHTQNFADTQAHFSFQVLLQLEEADPRGADVLVVEVGD